MPDYTAKWSQEKNENVDSWEFQYSGNGIYWHWVQHIEPVDDCDDCFEAIITIPENIMAIRVRAIGEGGSSEWSDIKYLPETSLTLGLILGFLFVLILSKVKVYINGTRSILGCNKERY
tara:strand:- start:598 stop:954 length:357 start_codon:yes stop_codon:yes gene_type:complete